MNKRAIDLEHKVTVVPIINVSLVVVLTLMMIAPFLSQEEVEVDLPQARASEVDDTDNIEITYTLDKDIVVGEDHLSLAELQPYLAGMFADMPHAVAVVKADQALAYGEVESLLAAIEAAQAPRIALATRKKEAGDQP